MYIRRKVFSVLANEEGEERLYSTTEFTNVYDDVNLEERSFAGVANHEAAKQAFEKLTAAQKEAFGGDWKNYAVITRIDRTNPGEIMTEGTRGIRRLEKLVAKGGKEGKAAAKELKAIKKMLEGQNKGIEENVTRYHVDRVPSMESYKTAAGMEARALREKGAEMGKKALKHVKAHPVAYGLGGAGLAAAGTGAAIYAHSRKNRE